uniref:Conotoxin n=1 Tax=Conus praecellens TaxID=128530 RepID=A0A291C2C1_CONPC|nr:conotoxin [Conus praecellens]
MMFRLTTVSCFLLVIVLLNLVVFTDACKTDEFPCSSDDECCVAQCYDWKCKPHYPWPPYKRGRRQVPFKVFGQR